MSTTTSAIREALTNNDIIEAIIDTSNWTEQQLCDVSLVCRSFRDVAIPRLYENMTINSYDKVMSLQRIPDDRLEYIRGFERHPQLLSSLTKVSFSEADREVWLSLAMLPSVKTLTVDADVNWCFPKHFCHPNPFQDVRLDGIETFQWRTSGGSDCERLFKEMSSVLPKLKRLYLLGMNAGLVWDELARLSHPTIEYIHMKYEEPPPCMATPTDWYSSMEVDYAFIKERNAMNEWIRSATSPTRSSSLVEFTGRFGHGDVEHPRLPRPRVVPLCGGGRDLWVTAREQGDGTFKVGVTWRYWGWDGQRHQLMLGKLKTSFEEEPASAVMEFFKDPENATAEVRKTAREAIRQMRWRLTGDERHLRDYVETVV